MSLRRVMRFCETMQTFYYYMIQIHHYGRVKDTHRRLSADEVDFFVPLDWEVSLRYLKWVCYKAKVFRGTEGQTRDIQVTEFIGTSAGNIQLHQG